VHHRPNVCYRLELHALDTKLDVPQGTPQEAVATRTAVVNAMDGHVLGKAVLIALPPAVGNLRLGRKSTTA
jgi:phosphatidylethanolamine-binding protein (PEBP) family uncharacterized protein